MLKKLLKLFNKPKSENLETPTGYITNDSKKSTDEILVYTVIENQLITNLKNYKIGIEELRQKNNKALNSVLDAFSRIFGMESVFGKYLFVEIQNSVEKITNLMVSGITQVGSFQHTTDGSIFGFVDLYTCGERVRPRNEIMNSFLDRIKGLYLRFPKTINRYSYDYLGYLQSINNKDSIVCIGANPYYLYDNRYNELNVTAENTIVTLCCGIRTFEKFHNKIDIMYTHSHPEFVDHVLFVCDYRNLLKIRQVFKDNYYSTICVDNILRLIGSMDIEYEGDEINDNDVLSGSTD